MHAAVRMMDTQGSFAIDSSTLKGLSPQKLQLLLASPFTSYEPAVTCSLILVWKDIGLPALPIRLGGDINDPLSLIAAFL